MDRLDHALRRVATGLDGSHHLASEMLRVVDREVHDQREPLVGSEDDANAVSVRDHFTRGRPVLFHAFPLSAVLALSTANAARDLKSYCGVPILSATRS